GPRWRVGLTADRSTRPQQESEPMQALIDASVHNATKYYETYRWEPSPAGDVTIGTSELTSASKLDFETVLRTRKKGGSGGSLLIATHSNPDGFMMSLKAGGHTSLTIAVMGKILEIAEGIRRREALKSVAADKLPAAWKKWFDDFDPGVELESGYEKGN